MLRRFGWMLAVALMPAVVLGFLPGCTIPRMRSASPGDTAFIRTPHFLDSFPRHKDQFAETPELVKINFDFDLANRSTIRVFKGDADVTAGSTAVTSDNLSMQAKVRDAGDGLYIVKFTAYWPDGTHHNGRFVFTVAKRLRGLYKDMRGASEVTVRMKDASFSPKYLIVDVGTKVTWVNEEDLKHFVNSDPHASHNVLPDLNSRGLNKGSAYSYRFAEPGEWAYHCSAHYPTMVAHIIVEGRPAADEQKAPEEAPEPQPGGPGPSSIEHIRTPHFVSSTPAHGETLTAPSAEVVIRFNFDLDHESSIEVTMGGQSITTGPTAFTDDDLTMTVPMAGRGGGIYIVKYTAFWPDKTSHQGQFAFAVP